MYAYLSLGQQNLDIRPAVSYKIINFFVSQYLQK